MQRRNPHLPPSRSTSVLACSRAGAPLPLASHGMQSSLSGNTTTPAYVRGRPSWAHVSISSGDEGVFDGQAPCREALSLRSYGRSMPLALRSEEHTSELQSQSNLVCRLLLEK